MLSKGRVPHCLATTAMGLLLTVAISIIGSAQDRLEGHAEDLAKACKSKSGTWLETYWECEYADSHWCVATGGRFDECASACRHSPESATVCTMQCVPTCVFSEKGTSPDGESPANCAFLIEGEPVRLRDGKVDQVPASGSTKKIKTIIFDDRTKGDLVGGGHDDVVVLLLQDSGGSGSFYYVAAALKTGNGYKGTNAIFMGDRIAPPTVEIHGHTIVVNYAERYPWQEFATKPSIRRSRFFFVEKGELKEKPFALLSANTATTLAIQDWGRCARDSNARLTANVIDGKGGVWYVEALCDERADTSVKVERKIAQARYKDGVWSLGDILLHQYKCQPNHGHEDFSTENCQ